MSKIGSYEVVDKKKTIQDFVSEYVSEEFWDKYFYVEIMSDGDGIAKKLTDTSLGDLVGSVYRPNVVFLHKCF